MLSVALEMDPQKSINVEEKWNSKTWSPAPVIVCCFICCTCWNGTSYTFINLLSEISHEVCLLHPIPDILLLHPLGEKKQWNFILNAFLPGLRLERDYWIETKLSHNFVWCSFWLEVDAWWWREDRFLRWVKAPVGPSTSRPFHSSCTVAEGVLRVKT